MSPGFRLALALGLPHLAGGATPEELAAAWAEGARLSFGAAAEAFAALGDAREARLGRAVMLINAQPKTAANISAARELLTALRAERGDDEPGIAALFHLARIAQFHGRAPDLAAARRHYQDLIAQHGAHFFGQLARLKLATLLVYDPEDPAPARDRLAAAEALGVANGDAGIARDYHLLMAGAYLRFNESQDRALEHLLAAERTRLVVRDVVRAALYVQIAECARELGRPALARLYYRRFLDEFPRDARGTTVRARLEWVREEEAP